MKKLALVAATALSAATLAISAPTLAATIITDTGSTFDMHDANKDGFVSWDEVLGAYPTLPKAFFGQADSNGDGVLDESEYASLQGLTAGFGDTSNEEAAI